jgi:hypothetical protein
MRQGPTTIFLQPRPTRLPNVAHQRTGRVTQSRARRSIRGIELAANSVTAGPQRHHTSLLPVPLGRNRLMLARQESPFSSQWRSTIPIGPHQWTGRNRMPKPTVAVRVAPTAVRPFTLGRISRHLADDAPPNELPPPLEASRHRPIAERCQTRQRVSPLRRERDSSTDFRPRSEAKQPTLSRLCRPGTTRVALRHRVGQ